MKPYCLAEINQVPSCNPHPSEFAITRELGIKMNLLRKWLPEFEQEELQIIGVRLS